MKQRRRHRVGVGGSLQKQLETARKKCGKRDLGFRAFGLGFRLGLCGFRASVWDKYDTVIVSTAQNKHASHAREGRERPVRGFQRLPDLQIGSVSADGYVSFEGVQEFVHLHDGCARTERHLNF